MMEAEARALGLPAGSFKRSAVHDAPVLWADMADSYALFCAMRTQWNLAGMGGVPIGLRYEVLEAVARATSIDLTPSVFTDIRVLESEALATWARKRK